MTTQNEVERFSFDAQWFKFKEDHIPHFFNDEYKDKSVIKCIYVSKEGHIITTIFYNDELIEVY